MTRRKVHRWQPNGLTRCGRKIDSYTNTNKGQWMHHGVTCKRCLRSNTIMLWHTGWNTADGKPWEDPVGSDHSEGEEG